MVTGWVTQQWHLYGHRVENLAHFLITVGHIQMFASADFATTATDTIADIVIIIKRTSIFNITKTVVWVTLKLHERRI